MFQEGDEYSNTTNKALKVGYVPSLPWGSESMALSGFGGVCRRMVDLIAEKLDLTYTTEPIYEYGAGLSNGTWTGVFGKLQRNEVDLFVGPWVVDTRDFEGLRTTGTIYSGDSFCLVASTDKASPSSFFGFIMTFSLEIWVYIFLSMALLIVVSILADFILMREKAKQEPLNFYFFTYLAALMYEGSPHVPPTFPSRFLFGVWLTALLVLINGFTGQFKALLMVSSNADIIKDVHDLAARTENIPQIPDYVTFYDCFKNTDNKVYLKVWDIINKRRDEAIIAAIELMYPKTYQKVKDGKATLIVDPIILKVALSNVCQSLVGPRRLYLVEGFCNTPYHFAFAVSNDFPDGLFQELKKRLRWIVESNLINVWIDYYTKNVWKCLHVEENQEGTPLGMDHLFGAFVLLFSLQGLAFIVLIREIIQFRLSAKYKNFKRKALCFRNS